MTADITSPLLNILHLTCPLDYTIVSPVILSNLLHNPPTILRTVVALA